MKYALISVVNGNFNVESEHGEDKKAAIIAFDQKDAALLNADDVVTAVLKVVDENFDTVDGRANFINNNPPQPEE